MCVFSFLVIIIFNFAFPPGMGDVGWIIPGILWVAFIFSGLLGMGRSFGVEKDKGSLQGLLLCPVGRGTIYVGKMVGNFIFMSMMEAFTLAIFSLLFNINGYGGLHGGGYDFFGHVRQHEGQGCDAFDARLPNRCAPDHRVNKGDGENSEWGIPRGYLSLAEDPCGL
jgi:hypothetical protein